MGAMQRRLYEFLKEHQCREQSFTLEQAVDATEYARGTLKTYLSKQLKDVWVTATDDRHFRVRGFESVSFAAFTDAVTQNTRLSFGTEEEWQASLRHVLALGIQRRYDVEAGTREALAELLLPAVPRAPRRTAGARQR